MKDVIPRFMRLTKPVQKQSIGPSSFNLIEVIKAYFGFMTI